MDGSTFHAIQSKDPKNNTLAPKAGPLPMDATNWVRGKVRPVPSRYTYKNPFRVKNVAAMSHGHPVRQFLRKNRRPMRRMTIEIV